MRCPNWLRAGSIAALIALAPPLAHARDFRNRDPNWPCMSIKVPELSIASMWAGPPVDPNSNAWSKDPQITELATRLAERRMPLDKAEAEIASFAKSAGEDRKTKLLELLVGLFDSLNGERASVIAGLDRFGARQIDLAGRIRGQLDTLHGLQDQPEPDTAKITSLGQQLQWETRLFEERRDTAQYVCAVPDKIEQRFFALARTIQQNLD